MSIEKALAAVEKFDDRALEWLQSGLRTWIAAQGSISLQRCLGLPAHASGLGRALRDFWLRQAFEAASGSTDEGKWASFEAELRSFMSWKRAAWQRRGQAPDYATPIERCLFNALRSTDPPSTRKQRRSIVHPGGK